MEQHFLLYRWKDLNRLTIKATGEPSPPLFPSFTFFIIAPSFPVTKWFPSPPPLPSFPASPSSSFLCYLCFIWAINASRKQPGRRRRCQTRADMELHHLSLCWGGDVFLYYTDTWKKIKNLSHLGIFTSSVYRFLWQFEMFRAAVFGVCSCFRLVLLRTEQSGSKSGFHSQPICSSKDAGSQLKMEVH